MEPTQAPSPAYMLFLSLVASVVRTGLVFLLGLFGVKWSEDQLGALTTGVATALIMMLVLLWSMVEKRVLLHTQPPASRPVTEKSDENPVPPPRPPAPPQ